MPYIHHDEHDTSHEHRHPSAMNELEHVGNEEDTLKSDEENHKRYRDERRHTALPQIGEEQEGGHEHRDGDGQTVGGFHVLGTLEEQNDEDAEHVERRVDKRYVELSLHVGGVFDFLTWPEL